MGIYSEEQEIQSTIITPSLTENEIMVCNDDSQDSNINNILNRIETNIILSSNNISQPLLNSNGYNNINNLQPKPSSSIPINSYIYSIPQPKPPKQEFIIVNTKNLSPSTPLISNTDIEGCEENKKKDNTVGPILFTITLIVLLLITILPKIYR